MNRLLNGSVMHCYLVENFDINSLSQLFIEIHSAGGFPAETRLEAFVEVVELKINSGLFSVHFNKQLPQSVEIKLQKNNSLALTCSCGSESSRLCNHEAAVLTHISGNRELTLFFDTFARLRRLKKYAETFGSFSDIELEEYFELFFEDNRTLTRTKIRGLFPLDANEISRLRSNSDKSKTQERNFHRKNESDLKKILVFRKHKYYKHLSVELAEVTYSQNGNLKGSLKRLKSSEFIWRAQSIQEAKFFSALQVFESNVNEQSQSHLEALAQLLSNPLQLDFYSHLPEVSESLTPKSLKPFPTVCTAPHFSLSIHHEGPFYRLEGFFIINEISIPVKNAIVRFSYFIELDGNYYLPATLEHLRLIELFRDHDYELLLHESRFELFRQNVLSELENLTLLHYTYLKPANSSQLQENGLTEAPQKLIYISESDPYIELNPVMRYGREEVSAIGNRQLYIKGIKGEEFLIDRDREAELAFTSLLVRQHPFFAEQLEQGSSFFYLHKKRFLEEQWFLNAFEEWQNQGIQILGFNNIRNNRLNLNKASVGIEVLSGTNWFNVNIEVKYGRKKASFKEIKKAVKNKSRYIELDDGTLGILPEEWLEKFRAYFAAAEPGTNAIRIPKARFAIVSQLFEQEVLSKDVKTELDFFESSLANFESIQEIAVPTEFRGELRGYQKQGLNWLNFLDDFNFGACLADDMGLGKTVQIIAFILLQRQKQTFNTNLLVVPTSLIENWRSEIQLFAPSLNVLVLYGNSRTFQLEAWNQYDIVLTSYGSLLSDIRILKNYTFNYVILDESQNIKNPESQRYRSVRLLKARNRIVLTGTPIENNTFDLYAQLSFACPGLLGSKQYFRDVYHTPIDKFKDNKRLEELQNLVKPFVLRRTKKQVATELPEKTEMFLYCPMQEEQRKIYEEYENIMREYLEGISNDSVARSSLHILRGLTQLRQICDSPLLLKDPTINTVSSAKIDSLLEQIESKSQQHKILVFSQFVGMLDLVKKGLDEKSISYVCLTGSTRNRGQVVSDFQDNPEVRVFLISLKAGGTGLNLTEADYVYLLDPWWNPAAENQAIDRAYRIGQQKHVIAVRMICPDTIEEKILKLQEQKKVLSGKMIGTDRSFFNSLTRNDLLFLLNVTQPLSIK